MSNETLLLLKENLAAMESAAYWLKRSLCICQHIGIKAHYAEEEYDAFETLTSRYARTIDLLTRKVLRTLDLVEFEQPGSLIDIVNRAEKRGLIPSVTKLRTMTDLRNEIAHDYVKDELEQTFQNVLTESIAVLDFIDNIRKYVGRKGLLL